MTGSPVHKKQTARSALVSLPEEESLEVLDGAGRPLLVMPREAVRRHRLPYKAVLVALRDKDGRLFLHKRSGGRTRRPGLWSLAASGPVLAGEAREDAARRGLAEELHIRDADLRVRARILPCEETNNTEVTVFAANSPASSFFLSGTEGMYVDQDELEALARELPHLLAPLLRCVLAAGVLFDRTKDA